MEKHILEACLQEKEVWSKLQDIVNSNDFSDIGKVLYTEIGEYYSVDPDAEEIDREILSGRLAKKYPRQEGELLTILGELGTTSPANVFQDVLEMKQSSLGREIANILVTTPTSPKLPPLMEEFTSLELVGVEEPEPASTSIRETLTELADPAQRIKIYPDALDKRLSEGAKHGQHIVVFARPNVGKTAFNINLTRGLLRDERRVLYLINEEPHEGTLKRLVGRCTGLLSHEIDADIDGAIAKAEPYLKNLFIKDITPGTFSEIRGLTKSIKPDVLIIDQLRNIRVKDENRVTALEHMAMEARNIGKEFGCLVISVTQAGDSARDKLVLDDGDIDYSNTGIPATADLIVGIGSDPNYRSNGRRMITIVKNKMGADHSSFPVSIDEGLAKILSL